MASTLFVDYVTPVPATWLNDVNRGVYRAYTALTSAAASIPVNLGLAYNFSHTLTENTTLANPSGAVPGASGVVEITQSASSARTLAYGSFWKKASADSLTISSTLGSKNILFYVVDSSGTFATCFLKAAVS